MTLWNKKELLEALFSQILEHNLADDLAVEEVLIDSRKATKNGLFVAIRGEKNDGHNFLEQSFSNGSIVALIDDKTKLPQQFPHGKNHQFLLVKNSFDALYDLARFSRKRSAAKIIAITGSVGKTSTKEMLRDAFSTYGKTFATVGNLNNHFGVPLSLCNFSADCAYGIFEMGMNHLHEIEPLSRLVKPHVAIITNVGPAHIENFKNEQEIALAKSEIFCGVVDGGKVLINRDSKHFEFLRDQAGQRFLASFGESENSDYQIISEKILDVNRAEIDAKLKNSRNISYQISSSNKAAIFNSVIVVATLDACGCSLESGLATLKNLKTPAGRGKILEVKFAEKKITIIDDSYNASLLSVQSGIEHAANLKKVLHKKRLVIALGDMLELGKNSIELHEEVMKFLMKFDVDLAILVGEEMSKAAQKILTTPHKNFSDSSAASLEIAGLIDDGDILYVKGSRGIKMEKLIEKLTPPTSPIH